MGGWGIGRPKMNASANLKKDTKYSAAKHLQRPNITRLLSDPCTQPPIQVKQRSEGSDKSNVSGQ